VEILGRGNIRVVGDGAGPDAPPSDVQGTAIDVHYTSPTTTASAPEDLSLWTLQAYIPDGSPGGFRVVDVAGHADGTFTIPSVPVGPYYLLARLPGASLLRFFQTASHSLEPRAPGATRWATATVHR
jgi:hypothetical protein